MSPATAGGCSASPLLLAGDYQDAEDLVQVALLRLASRWPAAGRTRRGMPGPSW